MMAAPPGSTQQPAKRARFSPPDVPSLISSLQNLQARAGKKLVSSNVHIYAKGGAFVQPEDRDQGNGDGDGQPVASGSTQAIDETAAGSLGEDIDKPYVPDPNKLYITSWKMSEHHYRRADCPFPTLARGLFTANEDYSLPDDGPRRMAVQEEEEGKGERIVGRGYDKFFNVGEVDWTKWQALETHTQAPYHLTYKSNGCLILISALSSTELLVASKHSLGTSVVPRLAEEKGGEQEKGQEKEVVGSQGWKNQKEKATEKEVVQKMEDVKLDSVPVEAVATDVNVESPVVDEDTDEKKPSKNAKKREAKARYAAEQKALKASQTASSSSPGESGNGQGEEDESQKMDGPGHATMGRRWLKVHLDRVGKEESDLAAVLWKEGVSCILELCDDSFEEHVLATPEHLTGLHLHGMNRNTPHFSTLPPDEVADFAQQWGFIPTASVTLGSIGEVREYADKVSREGKWKGDPIEGFVVRSTVADVSSTSTSMSTSSTGGEPPYPSGSPFFFKIKFDEPYMMYRQWREITKTLLPLRKPKCAGRKNRNAEPWTKLGSALKRPESKVYADWVGEEMIKNPEFFDRYSVGIVKVREAFLRWTEGEGKEEWAKARTTSDAPKKLSERKFLIAPIAIPGMGKTVLGVALGKLLPGMVHVQSDDVKTKKTGPTFLKNVQKALEGNAIVFADRNNHLPQHHTEISSLSSLPSLSGYPITRLAVVYDVDRHPPNKVLRLASERVLHRGENHQSLRPDVEGGDRLRHESVVKRFQNEFVPPEGGLFEHEFRLSVVDLPSNLKTAVEAIFPILGKPIPSDEEMDRAMREAMGYRTTLVKPLAGEPSKAVRYYALGVEFDLEEVCRAGLVPSETTTTAKNEGIEGETTNKEGLGFLNRLVDTGRIISKPHVTIVHEKTVSEEVALNTSEFESNPTASFGRKKGQAEQTWKACVALERLDEPTLFDFEATGLVWNERVMTLIVGNLRPHGVDPGLKTQAIADKEQTKEQQDAALRVEQALCETLVDVLHVTVGTGDETIPPYEARGLVEAWRRGEHVMENGGRVRYMELKGCDTVGRVVGMN